MIPIDKNIAGLQYGEVPFRVRVRRYIFGVARERRWPRYDCFLPAPLAIPERKLILNGVILDISQGGVLWRETSTYILDRRGAVVKVCIDGIWYQGMIVVVAPRGYSIRFDESLEEGLAFKVAGAHARSNAPKTEPFETLPLAGGPSEVTPPQEPIKEGRGSGVML